MNANRDGWVDALKGGAICLVVFGHTIGGLASSSFLVEDDKEMLGSIYRWIYSFHMPVFMIASGLFAHSSLERHGIKLFVKDKVCSLLYPYFVWGILTWICHNIARSWTNSQPNPMAPLQLIYNPAVGHWFLYVLAVLMVIFAVWTWLGGNRLFFFAFWVAIYFAGTLRELHEWPVLLIRLSELGIWFAFGVLGSKTILWIADKTSVFGLAFMFVFGFCIQTHAFMQGWDQELTLAIIPAFFGSLWLCAFSVLIERFGVGAFFRLCGRASLEIYVAGGLAETPARILLVRIFGVRNVLVHVFCGTLAGIGGPLLLRWTCKKFGWAFIFRCGNKSKIRQENNDRATAGDGEAK